MHNNLRTQPPPAGELHLLKDSSKKPLASKTSGSLSMILYLIYFGSFQIAVVNLLDTFLLKEFHSLVEASSSISTI